MNQVHSATPDKVTLLVFKDNFAARAFQVPLGWITRFGILLALILIFSTGATLTAIKYYRIAQQTDLARVQSLELELSDLKANLKTKENPSKSPSQPQASHSTQPNQEQQDTSSPAPTLQDETNMSPDNPVAALSKPMMNSIFSALVSGEPDGVIPDPKSISISVRNPRFSWQNTTLQVRFALQYNKGDQGSQQGKIVILARGPETLISYPPGTITAAGDPSLINFKNGEFFSVSRFRETKASLGPVSSKNAIQELEILILTKEGRVLLYQKFSIHPSDDS